MEEAQVMMLSVTLVAATTLGLLMRRLRVPGGLILGAMLGSGAVTLASDRSVTLPRPLVVVAVTSVGLLVGAMLTRHRIKLLKRLWLPATGSALILITVGLMLGFVLRRLGYSAGLAALATSPGAMSVLAGIAVNAGEDALSVMIFHVVRVFLMVLLIPVIIVLGTRRA